jgi:hypothetical protein
MLVADCQAAADLLGFPVPCPTALPATNNPVRCEIPGAFMDANVSPKEGCALGEGFLLSPRGIRDLDLFHLLIEGSLEEEFGCGMEDPHKEVQTSYGSALLFTCTSPGLHEGHTLIRLDLDGVMVRVSAHGHTDHNESAVRAIADTIEMVPPT